MAHGQPALGEQRLRRRSPQLLRVQRCPDATAAIGLPRLPHCRGAELPRHPGQAWDQDRDIELIGEHRDAGYCPGQEGLRKWAHALGYGGHCLTKSRAYSVTFGQLRAERREHRRRLRYPNGEHDPWGRPLDDTIVLVVKHWTCVGRGYTYSGDAEQALASAARARDHDQDDRAA
jgi:hypothetical protein